MYLPDHFAESKTGVLHEYIAKRSFGTLFTHGSNGLDANYLPFDLAATEGEFGTLGAHISRANPLWRDVANGDEVLVSFQAGDAYISPNWYPTKQETHRQVPTWNYIVVHAHGRIRFHDDEKFVRGIVARLTRTHEASQPTPWKMGDAPADYIHELIQRLVGLEIEITRLVGKCKLGQDEVGRDARGAGNELMRSGNHEIGAAMLDRAAGKPE
ncbi:FMN-binding negative transcriptional regulator [Burkholderia cenocepacia]|uniref:FMN-binding negative transcriptional regulator n=1 Tax=Burkholderia cenocepacia TaxID=95486 RepID=UPI0004F69264|nr:FMN-binding negative transcriptional regulator [Burkholderia cenocepacia]AIO43758.1 putative FMN-binding domain protein [Burkholderia cepacia]KGC05594.1 putative FMN-binding domain protein [Burkholderia cepacia]MCW3524465.1 FMN-binding negative transcriptional regulator [Burkholderia cenocepacia]MCW3614687.1 FMN-binding negative transcriptional regulator [Burkholderia cenocepacia]MCW3652625.1 FMN-binding negative transcriptional regulator [Burkholderia cenocepacia]